MDSDDCQVPPATEGQAAEGGSPAASQASQQMQDEEFEDDYTPPTSNESRTSGENVASPHNETHSRGELSRTKEDDSGEASMAGQEDSDHPEPAKAAQDGGDVFRPPSGKSSPEPEEVEAEEIVEEVEEEVEEEEGEERGEMDEAAATVVAVGAGPPAGAPQVEEEKQLPEGELPAEEDPDGSLREYAAALANMEEQDPTPDSSPRTKLSGVLSDAGESSPSNALDTGREFEEISNDPDLREQCSDAARQVVQEVLAKALQPDTDSDRDSDTGLGSLRQATSSLEHPSPPSFSPPALQLASSATGDGEGELGYSPAKYRDGGELPSPRAAVFQEDQKKEEEDEKRDHMDLEELETPRPDTQRPQADREEEEEEDAETGDRPSRKEAEEEEKEEDDEDDQRSLVGDGNDEDDSEAVTSQASPHPEYPMNYGNYKVCRRVSPGVKECLILETGEHIKYCKGRRLFEEQAPTDSAGQDSCNGAGSDSNDQGRKGFKVSRLTTDQGFTHLRLNRAAQLREEEEPEGQAGGDAFRPQTGARPDAILGGPGTRPLSGPGGQERQVAWEERQTATGGRLSEDEVPVRDVPSQQDHSQEGEEEEEEVEEVRDEIDRLLRQEGFNGLSATSQRLLAEAARNLRRVPHGGRPGLDVSPTATDRYNAGYRSATSAEGVSAPPGGWAGGQPAWVGGSTNTSEMEADLTNMEGSYLGERSRPPLSDRSPRPGLPRFDPYSLASPPAPGSVPSFKTLQEQQVSWMSMFRMLEDQHQRELQSQYTEHSRMIQEIQDQMERQLTNRQSSFSRRLSQHRHFLEESEGWGSHRRADGLIAPASPSLPAAPSPRPSSTPRGSRPSSLQASRLEMYGRAAPLGDEGRQDGRPQPSGRSHPSPPAALKPLLVDYSTEESQEADTEEERERRLPSRSAALHTPPRAAPNRMAEDVVRRAFEDSDEEPNNLPPLDPFLSSSDSAVMAARQQQARRLPGDQGLSQSLLGGDKLLRGGVYSSPMPLSRPRRPRSKAGQEGVDSRNTSLLSGGGDGGQRRDLSSSRQLDFDMDVTQDSARARTLLREEHSRHLAQLRDYYQQQVQELKSQLGDSAPARQSATEKILKDENKDLRRKCSDLADQLEDTKTSVRSLEQKVHGLEVRAADYSERYEKAERRLRGMEKQVVDGEDKLREREAQIAELDARTRQQTMALQEAYKLQNNLEESNRRDRSNLQRILEKYENLERDHSMLKESYAEMEKKLFETRNQVVDMNKIIASYEMLNKQLTRDNENLHNRLASAVSLKGYKTSYEDSYTGSRVNDNRNNYMNGTTSSRSLAAVNQDHVGELLHGGASLSAGDTGPSPLLTAERELQRLQAEGQSNMQLLRSHKKFYGSEPALASTAEGGRTPPKVRSSPSSKNKPSSKTGRRVDSGRGAALENGGSSARRAAPPSLNPLSQDTPSAVRFDIDHRPDRKDGSGSSGRVDVDRTLERVRAGDVVSRPQWEDVYTSLAKPSREPDLPATQGLSREEKIKERLRAISEMEHRYDDLTAERRRLESGLSKIPVSGRVDRKAKREKEELETRLDSVDKELGSLRMSLKRYQVLKSAQ